MYVHAKVGIIDDEWLTIGSANLNNHSLFNDTEMNVVVRDAAIAKDTRLRLWAEHLEVPRGQLEELTPLSAIDELWEPIARDQFERRTAGSRSLTESFAYRTYRSAPRGCSARSRPS